MRIYQNGVGHIETDRMSKESEDAKRIKRYFRLTKEAIAEAVASLPDDGELIIVASAYIGALDSFKMTSVDDILALDHFAMTLSSFDSKSDDRIQHKVERRKIEADRNSTYYEFVICPDFNHYEYEGQQFEDNDKRIVELTIRVYYEQIKIDLSTMARRTDSSIARGIKAVFREKYD